MSEQRTMRFGAALDKLTSGKYRIMSRPNRRPIILIERANRPILAIGGEIPYIPTMDDMMANDWTIRKSL